MKLVDILAREMKAWPEGVGSLAQSFGGMVFHVNSDAQVRTMFRTEISEDWRELTVTHTQWQAAVDALKAEKIAEWNGEGLPPVGSVCEHSEDDNKADRPDGAWKRVKIVGHHQFNDDEYLCAVWVSGLEVSYSSEGPHFRPIRTTEQISAEERNIAINAMVERCPYPGSDCTQIDCAALYDAGYRKFEIVDN